MSEKQQPEMGQLLPMREKLWDEMNDSERIKKMRDEIILLHTRLGRVIGAVDVANNHIHAPNGDVMVSANRLHNEPNGFKRQPLR